MAPNQSPIKRAGRPKKHQTDLDAAEAIRASKLRSYHRSRQASRQGSRQIVGPASFIAYEPPHPGIPTDTPPSGLRTSSDIRIPIDSNIQSSDIPQNLRPISPPPTQLPQFDEHAEIAAQIKQIQVDEQEVNLERDEYEAEIAEILIGLRSANATSAAEGTRTNTRSGSPIERLVDVATSTMRTMEHLNTAGEDEVARNEEAQHSCSSQISSVDEPIMKWDNDRIAASNTSNRPANIQRSPENIVPLETPTQHRSPPLPLSSRTSSKGSTSRSFPAQKNSLLSWLKPLARRSPTNIISPPPALEGPPSNASSLLSGLLRLPNP